MMINVYIIIVDTSLSNKRFIKGYEEDKKSQILLHVAYKSNKNQILFQQQQVNQQQVNQQYDHQNNIIKQSKQQHEIQDKGQEQLSTLGDEQIHQGYIEPKQKDDIELTQKDDIELLQKDDIELAKKDDIELTKKEQKDEIEQNFPHVVDKLKANQATNRKKSRQWKERSISNSRARSTVKNKGRDEVHKDDVDKWDLIPEIHKKQLKDLKDKQLKSFFSVVKILNTV